MSHMITFSAENARHQVSVCNNLKNKINDKVNHILQFSYKNNWISNEEKKLSNELNELIQKINSFSDVSYDADYGNELISTLTRIDTLSKHVANLFDFWTSLAKDENVKTLILKVDENYQNSITEWIKQHSSLAIETIEYMKNNNISFTKENFKTNMDIISNQKLEDKKIEQYINNAIDFINETTLSSNLKLALIKEIKNQNDISIIKDLNAYVQSRENDYIRTLDFAKKILELFSKQEFKKCSDAIWSIDSETNNLVLKFNMKNRNNNTVSLIIDSTNHIKYKLGNYVGHACEKTTEKFMTELKKHGYKIGNINVSRSFESDQKYMYIDDKKKKNK